MIVGKKKMKRIRMKTKNKRSDSLVIFISVIDREFDYWSGKILKILMLLPGP